MLCTFYFYDVVRVKWIWTRGQNSISKTLKSLSNIMFRFDLCFWTIEMCKKYLPIIFAIMHGSPFDFQKSTHKTSLKSCERILNFTHRHVFSKIEKLSYCVYIFFYFEYVCVIKLEWYWYLRTIRTLVSRVGLFNRDLVLWNVLFL